ncbi:MAG: hypothetical protein DRH21_05390 [Deltaproteobacteria bacterium]|nr:MAG: hypothetical protein DRH21_05390 [Deltaproteobacteria bacterium]
MNAKSPIFMDCCMHIRLFAESLHNIPYQTLLKSIKILLKQKTRKTLNEILICDNFKLEHKQLAKS